MIQIFYSTRGWMHCKDVPTAVKLCVENKFTERIRINKKIFHIYHVVKNNTVTCQFRAYGEPYVYHERDILYLK